MNVHESMESIADLLIAGGLRPEEKAEAERHAAECAACGTLLRDAREFATWTKGLIAKDAPPADLEDRLIERFRAAQPKKRRLIVGTRVLKVTGSIAAAVGLIFLGNVFSQQSGSSLLRQISSAEADFRANDRDWNHVNDLWTGDVRGLYSVTTDGLQDKTRQGLDRGLSRAEKLMEDLAAVETRTVEYSRDQRHLEEKQAQTETTTALAAAPKAVDELRRGRMLGANGGKAERNLGEPDAEKGDKLWKNNAFRLASTDLPNDTKPGTGMVIGNLEDSTKPVPQDNRKIIRTADVALEVESYDATYTKLTEIAAAEKGHVASANTQKMANGKIQATVILRIPPERFEAVLARFKDLGTVRHQNVGSDDVTKAYIDLESRLASKQVLAQRLSKLLAEGKGTVKELMEVEVQMGATNEAIEQIKGEIKYYDNRVGLSTLTLQIAEKDLGQPFEYVQTLTANLALTVRDPDDAYAKAQKEIVDAGGQVVDSRMTRQNDGASTGTIRARVDADKFQGLRDALKKYGVATNDTVNQQKSARGGREGTPKPDAPLRKEQAVLDLTLNSPPVFVTRKSQLLVETPEVESAYQNSRKAAEAAGGKIVDGSLNGRTDRMAAVLKIQIDADKFATLVDSLKSAGKVKNAVVNSVLPATAADGGAALLRERAEIELSLISPPQLIADENGLGKSIRDTLANSWAGFLWSIEKLFVGLSLAGPWIVILAAGILLWRRSRRKKAVGNP